MSIRFVTQAEYKDKKIWWLGQDVAQRALEVGFVQVERRQQQALGHGQTFQGGFA